MSTPDMEKAHEWVAYVDNQRDLYGDKSVEARAAARVIQSLPNIVVDGEEILTIYDKYRDDAITLHEAFHAAVALAIPPLPTLADLIELGNKPEDYQWMQCTVDGSRDHAFVIAVVGECFNKVLRPDGPHQVMSNDRVTPLPDLPKLEWPGDGMEDAPIVDDEPALPHPEDVSAGEPWLVLSEGRRAVGYRNDPGAKLPWVVAYQDHMEFDYCYDSDITLVSRLVPDTP